MKKEVEHNDIEIEVLKRIRPSAYQVRMLSRFYELLKRKLEDCLKKEGLKGVIEAEGSYAKGTLISDKWELDVFILFEEVTEDWILNNSASLLKKCLEGFPLIIRYAQHPYVTVHLMGMQADVVPALLIKKPKGRLGVERTPFHTRYIVNKIKGKPWLVDEIRLFKSFLKGIGVYGAETSVGGFSGYLAELLTIYYGSFRKTLDNISRWEPGMYIDPENVGDKESILKKYKDSVLFVVDPVDPERNVAAAVTLEKLATLILSAKVYLKRPCKEFFHIFRKRSFLDKRRTFSSLRRTLIIYLVGSYYNIPRDAFLGMLKSLSERAVGSLREKGFVPLRYGFYTDTFSRAAILIELETLKAPEVELMKGPPAWVDENRLLKFIMKRVKENGYAWIDKNGYLEGLRPRKIIDASEALRDSLKLIRTVKGTSKIYIIKGDEARGWLQEVAQRFIEDVPVWNYCLSTMQE